ncbi:MAG: Amino acid kinase [Cenarchaeum symbiont of Oopsacas minuta]|nr:Amino acid kinase [Cenarchaeum symbiont of Oopsacas minuta]
MILIKLGGSIITEKKKPLTSRKKAILKIGHVLSKIKEPIIIVHGGGSFGHYWSIKYDMHTEAARYNPKGVTIIKNSMVTLNKIVLDGLLGGGLTSYCAPPFGITRAGKLLPQGAREIAEIAKYGLVPVTYGDAMWYSKGKSFILSGDRIMTMLALALKPRMCIFATNVDGLYENPNGGKLIYNAADGKATILSVGTDVTGGMLRKVKEAKKISCAGTDVYFVNGNKPERIIAAIRGKKFPCTKFGGKKR